MWAKHKQSGFTIVELLVVIVVITVLAAISILAYNGVHQRAKESKLIAGVNSYVKAMQQYKAVNGDYPVDGGCLGAGYESNACWYDATSPNMSVNSSLDSALSPFLSQKFNFGPDRMSIGVGAYNRGGLAYIYNDGTYGRRLVYYLNGINRSCGISGKVTPANEGGVVTQCNITLP